MHTIRPLKFSNKYIMKTGHSHLYFTLFCLPVLISTMGGILTHPHSLYFTLSDLLSISSFLAILKVLLYLHFILWLCIFNVCNILFPRNSHLRAPEKSPFCRLAILAEGNVGFRGEETPNAILSCGVYVLEHGGFRKAKPIVSIVPYLLWW